MIPYFPKTISSKGLAFYIVSLLAVSIAFFTYAMSFMWMLLGIVEVSLFFVLSSKYTKEWQTRSVKDYERTLFWTAVLLRVVWVTFSYFFYKAKTGQPFEFDAADSLGYHGTSAWLAGKDWNVIWDYFKSMSGVSDTGYIAYLTVVYKIIGPNIYITRIIKCLLGAFSCVLLYRLAKRSISESVGRMVGVFAMLMPNLIIYCGLHLKETEMMFIIVAFLERADYVLRSKKFTFFGILVPILLAASMFTLRTVLGAAAMFSFVTAVVFSPSSMMRKGRRWVIIGWMILAIAVLAGGVVMNEAKKYWNDKETNQVEKRADQTDKGNLWAKYATGTVLAPMVFVLPFSTMVDTGQENQMMLHGGNYVRNFMGVFVLIALFIVLFKKKNWRDFALIGSFVVSYLGVVSMSGFANSERFLLPGLPCLMIMWAYGISELTAKSYRFVKCWYVVVIVMEFAWAYFKLGSRGLV